MFAAGRQDVSQGPLPLWVSVRFVCSILFSMGVAPAKRKLRFDQSGIYCRTATE